MAYTKKAPLEGNLEDVLLPHIFIKILMMNLSGILVVYASDRTVEIYFRKGQVVHVSSDYEEDRFGTFLLRMGAITEVQLELVLQEQKKVSNTKIGHLLVQKNIIPPHLISQYLNEYHAEALFAVFKIKRGAYRYVKNGRWSEDIGIFDVPTYKVLFDAIEEHYSTEDIRGMISLSEEALVKKQSESPLMIPLPPIASKIYNAISKETKVSALINQVKVSEHKVFACLFMLTIANFIDLRSKIKSQSSLPVKKDLSELEQKKLALVYQSYCKKNFFEMFSVPFQLNPQKIQAQFFSLMKQFKPFEGSQKGDQLIQWTKVGYAILMNQKTRIDYIQRLKVNAENADKMEDDRSFYFGLYLVQKSNLQAAFEVFKSVFEKHPTDVLYRVYYWGAKFELDPGKETFGRALKVFERNQNIVLSESYLSYVYALMLLKNDEGQKARKIIKHESDKNPDYQPIKLLLDEMRLEESKMIQTQRALSKSDNKTSRFKEFIFQKIGQPKVKKSSLGEDEELLDPPRQKV